jgi:hypothetical protein
MKSSPRQMTLGSLMILIAAVALLLAIPRGYWSMFAAMLVVFLGSFGLTVLIGKLVLMGEMVFGDARSSSRTAAQLRNLKNQDRRSFSKDGYLDD